MNNSLLLCSSLSVHKPNSFSRQLHSLGKALGQLGWDVVLVGRKSSIQNNEPVSGPERGNDTDFSNLAGRVNGSISRVDIKNFDADFFQRLVNQTNANSAILLGYPDQFPFLQQSVTSGAGWNIPVFLWAQFSRPPTFGSLGSAIPVPLTWMSAMYLVSAGYPMPEPIIPHGVDTSVFYSQGERNKAGRWVPTRAGTISADATPVLGTVGANSRRKRFDTLLESFKYLMEETPNAVLVIKTDTPVNPEGFDILSIATSLGIKNNVNIIAEALSEHKMAKFYRQLDVYIQSSEWEGFGIPIIEAMASGIPVVSPPIQGPTEILPYTDLLVQASVEREGETVLRRADSEFLAKTVLNVLDNPVLRSTLDHLGRQQIEAHFDLHIVARAWDRAIRNQVYSWWSGVCGY